MTRFVSAVVSLVLLLVHGADAAEKRPLSLDDLYRQEEVTNFTISPRGDEAVYVRNWYDVNSPGKRTALWRVDGETGRHAPLEAGEPDGRMPVYSPDGDILAFVSDRSPDNVHFRVPVPTYSDRSGAVWTIGRHLDPEYAHLRYLTERARMCGYNHEQVFSDAFYRRTCLLSKRTTTVGCGQRTR